MMDQIASLMARGLISPDAAQGLVQKMSNQGFAQRLEENGHNPERIDDRRGDPESGYQHMMAYNQRIRMITRYLLGLDPQGGEKGAYDELPGPEGPPGKLEKDVGVPDIGKHLGRHYYELAPENGRNPTSWGYDPTWQRGAKE